MEEYVKSKLGFESVKESLRKKQEEGQAWCMKTATLVDELFCCSPLWDDAAKPYQNEETYPYVDKEYVHENVADTDAVVQPSFSASGSSSEDSATWHRGDKSSHRSSDPQLRMKREEGQRYNIQLALSEVYSTEEGGEAYQHQRPYNKWAEKKMPSRCIRRIDSYQSLDSNGSILQKDTLLYNSDDNERFYSSNLPNGHSARSFVSAELAGCNIQEGYSPVSTQSRFIESPGRKYFSSDASVSSNEIHGNRTICPPSPMRKVDSIALPELPYLTLTEGYQC